MKLSRTVAYAIQATSQLAAEGGNTPVASRVLAETAQLPDRFLLQILRSLVSHGLLHSTRGVMGGYTLARDANQISLLEIIEAVEGAVSLEMPLTSSNKTVNAALERATERIRGDLDSVKLSDLVGKTKANGNRTGNGR